MFCLALNVVYLSPLKFVVFVFVLFLFCIQFEIMQDQDGGRLIEMCCVTERSVIKYLVMSIVSLLPFAVEVIR